jgi:hypothetical protein
MPKRTLFDLTTEALEIEAILEASGGDVTDEEIARALDHFLAEHASDLRAKVDGYVYLMAEFEARARLRREEAKRLQQLAATDEHNLARLRRRLMLYFERTGKDRFETDHFKLAVVANGGVAPLILAGDIKPEGLPERFRKVKLEIDNEAIREALKRGEELPFAMLGERGKSLRIK